MSEYRKISIVTPSYNQGDFLEETILSVLSQGYPNLEYIIIDGGSTDQSPQIIEKYRSRLSFALIEPDRGQSHAINKGFRKATGEIFTWLCSDDYFMPNVLFRINELYNKHPEASVIWGKTEVLKGESRQLYPMHFDLLPYVHYVIPFIPQPSAFFRPRLLSGKDLVEEHLHYAMDYELWLRLIDSGDFLFTDEVFSAYRMHEHNKSSIDRSLFHEEYDLVFSRLLRSFQAEKEINIMKSLELYREDKSTYDLKRLHDSESKQRIFSTYLYRLFIRFMNRKMPKEAMKAAEALKIYDLKLYDKMLKVQHKDMQLNNARGLQKAKFKIETLGKRLFGN